MTDDGPGCVGCVVIHVILLVVGLALMKGCDVLKSIG